ncbi:MAG TPA: ester cyclase [Rhodanobacteraceae bacterium]|nr:ester cyclase [Rhodanobacteraceae bacterium]
MAHDVGALARRWFEEVWTASGEPTIDALMAEGSVGHMEGAEVRGPAAFKAVRAQLLGAFPDLAVRVEEIIAAGDNAVIRWSVAATHEGDDLGIPASHQRVGFRGLTWMKFRDGRIVEGWDAWNQGALIQSLSAIDATGVGAG